MATAAIMSRTVHRCDYCCSTFGNAANVARHMQSSHPHESRLVGVRSTGAQPINLVFGSFNAMADATGPVLLEPAATDAAPAVVSDTAANSFGTDVDMGTAPSQMVAAAPVEAMTTEMDAMDETPLLSSGEGDDGVEQPPLAGSTDVCSPGVNGPLGNHDDDSDGDGSSESLSALSGSTGASDSGADTEEVYDVGDMYGAIENVAEDAVVAITPPAIVPSSAAARVRAYYERLPEATAAQFVVDPVWGTRASDFNSSALRCALRFALTAGGSGLTERDQVRYARSLQLIETEATRGTSARGPVTRAFPNPRSFLTATRREVNRVLAARQWQKVPISIGGHTYVFFFRDILQAGLDALAVAKEVAFGDSAEMLELDLDGDDTARVRHGTLDSDLLQGEAQHVRKLHGPDARVMAVQLHADEAVVSWSGANYMFPVRAKFVNVLDNGGTWVTVGYLEHIPKSVEKTGAARLVVSDARNELFQRSLAVALATLVRASESGVTATVGTRGAMHLLPRVVGLIVDQVEERNFYALMGNRCRFFCSICMEDRSMSGAELGIRAVDRDVVATLDAQLAAAAVRAEDPRPSRRRALGAEHSALAFVPALGAIHGLGTGATNLYRVVSFDVLHVWKLGILRMLAQRLPAVFLSLCQGRGGARFGSVSATLDAINLRGWHLGRNCSITPAPPGYDCLLLVAHEQRWTSLAQRAIFLLAGRRCQPAVTELTVARYRYLAMR